MHSKRRVRCTIFLYPSEKHCGFIQNRFQHISQIDVLSHFHIRRTPVVRQEHDRKTNWKIVRQSYDHRNILQTRREPVVENGKNMSKIFLRRTSSTYNWHHTLYDCLATVAVQVVKFGGITRWKKSAIFLWRRTIVVRLSHDCCTILTYLMPIKGMSCDKTTTMYNDLC